MFIILSELNADKKKKMKKKTKSNFVATKMEQKQQNCFINLKLSNIGNVVSKPFTSINQLLTIQ